MSLNGIKVDNNIHKPKRPRNVLTLAEKVQVLDKLNEGVRPTALGRMFHLSESTIRTIKQNEDKIRLAFKETPARKVPKYKSQNKTIKKMEKELNAWLSEQQQNGIELTPIEIREKAKNIFTQLQEKGEGDSAQKFIASISWYANFKKRYLENLTAGGDIESMNYEFDEKYLAEMQDLQTEEKIDEQSFMNSDTSNLCVSPVQIKCEVDEVCSSKGDSCSNIIGNNTYDEIETESSYKSSKNKIIESTKIVQESWHHECLDELFIAVKVVNEIITKNDPIAKRSMKVIHDIHQALNPYYELISISSVKHKGIGSDVKLSSVGTQTNQHSLNDCTNHDITDKLYILP